MLGKNSRSHSPRCEVVESRSEDIDDSDSLYVRNSDGCKVFPWDDGDRGVPSPYGNYHTVSGANANYLKDALSRNIYTKSVDRDDAGKSHSKSKIHGLFSKRLSVSPQPGRPPTPKQTGKVKQFFGSLKNRAKSVSAESGGRNSPDSSNHGSFDVGRQPRSRRFLVVPSHKEPEIGPNEYIQMYRERTFSDTSRAVGAKQAVADKLVAGGSMTRSYHAGTNYDDEDQLHYLVWRDRKGDTTIYKIPTTPCTSEEDGVAFSSADACYARFFNEHTCYDVVPTSSKVVVFDTRLAVKRAFNGLVTNGVKAAILWDTKVQNFTGMLTVTDFMKILDKYYNMHQESFDDFENDSIEKWKNMLEPQPLVHCSPEDKLLHALSLLNTSKVHRLLVVDRRSGNPINVLTHKRMLNFLRAHLHCLPEPPFMQDSIASLGIGTFSNLATITHDMTLIETLRLFHERRVSALPVLSESTKLVGMFAKFDFSRLAYDKLYSKLDRPVTEILPKRPEDFANMHTCRGTDTLKSAVDKIVEASVHRLVVVDEDEKVVGILSLSDILERLVLRSRDEVKEDSG